MTGFELDDVRGPSRACDEDDLCALWASGDLPPDALTTATGTPFQVVYPGRRNGAAGPDFLGAMLVDGSGHLRTGDVEVHLRAHDWVMHGHRADPVYDGVVLHVVLEDDGAPCLNAKGDAIPVFRVAGLLVRLLTAAPLIPSPETQVCRVAAHLSAARVREIVDEAGRVRLGAKADVLEAQSATVGSEQALFAALLDAAGYSRNRVPCGLLAQRIEVQRLLDLLSGKSGAQALTVALAVLLGLAGLLPTDAPEHLTAAWMVYGDLWSSPPLHQDDWVRAGVRPANKPEVRIHGVAALLARYAVQGPAAAFLALVRAGDISLLIAAVEVPASDGERTPPIGRSRAVETIVNVIVPFALAVAAQSDDAALATSAWRLAAALPAGENTDPTRRMHDLLASSGHRLRAPGALTAQGLLHLYRSYCALHACWDCPLAQPQPPGAGVL